MRIIIFSILVFISGFSQAQPVIKRHSGASPINNPIVPAANRTDAYFPLLKGKSIAVVANQTSMIGQVHLVDSLLTSGINVIKVFTPEHGFRGNAEAGAFIGNDYDSRTGLPLISLYDDHKKPTTEDLKGVDLVLFDLQDVGARFYTYISTLTYVMEACAVNNIEIIVLDRPNPNGFYVDGPVLEEKFSSFVGLHAVPVVYGMTIAEYAQMVNGEGWLPNGVRCKLRWIELKGYTHESRYRLPVKPSPNLPKMASVYLYPSLCFFEGTVVSVGRGTAMPFMVIGHPQYKLGSFVFTPQSIKGVSENPPLKGRQCNGLNLENAAYDISEHGRIELGWLISMYESLHTQTDFFNNFFDKLAGTEQLRKQIVEGKSELEIRESWKPGIEHFKTIRKKYLLYPDFE